MLKKGTKVIIKDNASSDIKGKVGILMETITEFNNGYVLIDFGEGFNGHDGGSKTGTCWYVQINWFKQYKKGNYNNYV